MSRLTVLQALQTILETEFARVYVYPDDMESSFIEEPTLPFLTIEELPGVDNGTQVLAADWVDANWFMAVQGYVYKGTTVWTSAEDIAAKALAYPARDTVRTLLEANTSLSGTTKQMGDGEQTFTDMLTPLPWNANAYYGFYFVIPVTSG